ncbi:hypothetical protein ABZ725_38455 [Streptomyces sp. NPDC006872]|uniref:hypothetical protein n=1 Tax=Streptomyces sp. NPDC006872 TaxID=3155720 RepID=UPI0033FDF916
MTTGRAPRAGAAARLLGPALLAGALATATGCGGASGDSTAARTPSPPLSPSPSSSSASPEELCTRIVAHWAREVLDGTTYGDYQSMGLSNGQYDILRTVVDAARAAKKTQGADAAGELIDREAREGCADRYRSGGPDEGPWQ